MQTSSKGRTAKRGAAVPASILRWAERHPEKARSERALRKARAVMTEQWGHKAQGTMETHARAARVHQGAIARMYERGKITLDQLGAASELRSVAERIGGDVAIRTCSMETRVDTSRGRGDGTFYEALAAVRAEVAYGRWRRAMGPQGAIVLDIVADDQALTVAARKWHMHVRRAQRMLCEALDMWSGLYENARDEISEADLIAAQAGIL